MKTKNILIVSLAILTLLLVYSVKVQETSAQSPSKSITVIAVNIYDAKIIEQKENIFKFSFNLANQIDVQPEIKYAVILMKQTEQAQTKIDEKIYSEIVNLDKSQTLFKEITYTAPAYLNGNFQLWLTAQNTSGLMLAMSPLGEIKLNGNGKFLEINNGSCYLKVEKEVGDKKYNLMQGVDIKNDEKLIATCEVINHYDNEVILTPGFKTYWRNTFGQLVEDNQEPQSVVSLKAQESKELTFVLPKAQKPQAYDAVLTLLEGNKIISNPVTFHYVLRGPSSTIQSIQLDKDYYAKGETAKLSFFWSAAADAFPGSRFGATQAGILTAQVNITDKNGQTCVESINKELVSQAIEESLDLSIIANCVNPQISAIIKDASGQTLDQKTYSITSQNIPSVVTQNPFKKYVFYIVAIFVILLIIILAVILFKRRSSALILLFFLVGLGTFFSSNSVEAEVFDFNGTTTYTVNLNKTIFSPGETIAVSATGTYYACANANAAPLLVSINGVTNTVFSGYGYGYGNFTAQSSPGNYSALAIVQGTVCTGGWTCGGEYIDCCSWGSVNQVIGAIPYTVICTPTSWSPDPSTVCSGTSFTQTSNCGTTRSATGTKVCDNGCASITSVCTTCWNESQWVSGTVPCGTACSGTVCAVDDGCAANTCIGEICWNSYQFVNGTKVCAPAVPSATVTLNITPSYPATVPLGSSSSLTWTANNATSCTATGAWSGSKNNTSGTESVTPPNLGSNVYSIQCVNSAGTPGNTASSTITTTCVPNCNQNDQYCNGVNYTGNCSQTCTGTASSDVWTAWSDCSASCGGGTETHSRTCIGVNPTTETRSCNSQPCPPNYREVAPW